jgi:protein-S-isoprenylcysteine O-methyltransferase Ste14
MMDWPAFILVATIWAYWFGVGVKIGRVRRRTRRLAGLVPEQTLERAMWLVWVPLVAAWVTLPCLALVRTLPPLAVPAFARLAPGYVATRWVAAGFAVIALLLTTRCWSRMGAGWRMDVSTSGREPLITDGMFGYVRHPIYALSMVLMACSVIVVPTLPMVAVGAIHWLLLQIKARNEERHLTAVHGDAYRAYAEHTPRFVPRRLRLGTSTTEPQSRE